MSSLGDRRLNVRLEVVGALRGTLEVPAAVRLVNISQTGALIESPHAIPLDSTQIVHFTIDDQRIPVEALVRHVRQSPRDSSAEYLVGIEFVSAPIALLQSIEMLVPENHSGV